MSFILLYKGWNFWFIFDWEGERNSGFCDLYCWGSCKDERLTESWAKWEFKTKIEEYDFFYSYMVVEKIWENLGMWKKKKSSGYVLHVQDLCELRERPIPLFDFVSLAFLCYFFVLGGERH